MIASIPRRFLAMMLDAFFLILPGFIAEQMLPAVGSILITFLYFTMFESSAIRATPGKFLVGVQVTDMSGGRIAFRTAVIRYFMKIVSGILFFIGYLIALFTKQRQALHDLVAETLVVYGRNEMSVTGAWWDQMKDVFSSQASTTGGASRDKLAELERLQALREKGALTEEEFLEQKRKLLG